MNIGNFKSKMIEKAKKRGGVWENFGQAELVTLKAKYHYNPYATRNAKEFDIKKAIYELETWAMSFDLSQLVES